MQLRELEIFHNQYPDHHETLQVQIAQIACFFANIYTKRKDGGTWSINDFMVKFERKKDQEEPKKNVSELAIGLAATFGDDKTKKWAERKAKEKGIIPVEEKEYEYPLEKMLKKSKANRLPARLRNQKKA